MVNLATWNCSLERCAESWCESWNLRSHLKPLARSWPASHGSDLNFETWSWIMIWILTLGAAFWNDELHSDVNLEPWNCISHGGAETRLWSLQLGVAAWTAGVHIDIHPDTSNLIYKRSTGSWCKTWNLGILTRGARSKYESWNRGTASWIMELDLGMNLEKLIWILIWILKLGIA